MKKCLVYGDMSSDRAGEQYPAVNLCDDCIEDDHKLGERAQVVAVAGPSDDALGDSCEWCGASAAD